jgi:hypothetical protein
MIKQYIFTLILAFITALWEIQVEGKEGWAKQLPTFRINVFFRKLLGGKPLTGYHIFLLLLFVIVFHGLFINELGNWEIESTIFGLICWFFVIEDIMWFIFNPHYTLKKFKNKQVEWHSRWWLGLPITYWWGGIIGTLLLIFGGK